MAKEESKEKKTAKKTTAEKKTEPKKKVVKASDKIKKVTATKDKKKENVVIEQQFVKASVNYVRVSPYKMRKVSNEVRGKNAVMSLKKLKIMPQKSARILYKLLKSCIANAVNNNNLDDTSLEINKLLVNQGPSFKRAKIRARGRIFSIKKPTTHVCIELTNKGVQ